MYFTLMYKLCTVISTSKFTELSRYMDNINICLIIILNKSLIFIMPLKINRKKNGKNVPKSMVIVTLLVYCNSILLFFLVVSDKQCGFFDDY